MRRQIKRVLRPIYDRYLRDVPMMPIVAQQPAAAPAPRFCQYLGENTVLTETFFNRKIFLDSTDFALAPHIMIDGRWDPQTTQLLIKELRPGDVFVDVGANCGYFSLLAAHLVGQGGYVLAVEPQQRLAMLVKHSLMVNGFTGWANVEQCGVGAAKGTARLNKIDHLAGSATLFEDSGFASSSEDIRIETMVDLVREEGARVGRTLAPSIVKIDVEGFEYQVWQGMGEMVAARKDLLIIMEFTPVHYRSLGIDPFEFLAEIKRAGFTCSVIDHDASETPVTDAHLNDALQKRNYMDLALRKGRYRKGN